MSEGWEAAARGVGLAIVILAAGSSRNWNGWDWDPLWAKGPARRWWMRAFALWLGLALLVGASLIEGRGGGHRAILASLGVGTFCALLLAVVLLATNALPAISRDRALLRETRQGASPRHRSGGAGDSLVTPRALAAAVSIVLALAFECVSLTLLLAA